MRSRLSSWAYRETFKCKECSGAKYQELQNNDEILRLLGCKQNCFRDLPAQLEQEGIRMTF